MKKLALPLLPLLLGGALVVLWQTSARPVPILYLRADALTLLLIAGGLGSLAWWMILLVWLATRRRADKTLSRFQHEQAAIHLRFIRRLDHELKNPLTAIRAGLANLGEQNNRATLTSVRTQVDRLARLTMDLRKLADLETQAVEREAVDVGQVLEEVLELAQERRPTDACPIGLNLPRVPWPLPPVAGDRDLIFLALHNLVDNACKFCGPENAIEIRAFEDGPFVAIEVADTGPGVPDNELPHLGEELYRGSAAISVEGSGLGLALAQAIVKRHDGALSIRSRLGQGTAVTLRFPIMRNSKDEG